MSIARVFSKVGKGLTAIRRYTAHVLTVIVLFSILGLLFSSEESIEVPEGALLYLNLNGSLHEFPQAQDPFNELFGETLGSAERHEYLYQLIRLIEHAQQDTRIAGMVIDTHRFSGGDLNSLYLLGDAIAEFSASGKKVFSNADNYSRSSYILASQADEVYLNPLGSAMLDGFTFEQPYYGKALEKLKVKINVFRVGDYKSAVEPWIANGMSDEARANTEGWGNELWQQYLRYVNNKRDISPLLLSGNEDDFLTALEQANNSAATLAAQGGLVDGLMQRHEFRQYLIEQYGEDEEGYTYRYIAHNTYWDAMPAQIKNTQVGDYDSLVAVIHAEGIIVDGEGGEGMIGGDSLAQEIRQAAHNDKVKAVVLRVNSPGGSAFASEVIRQELLQLQVKGIPVVASMGAVAASGGYWISTSTDYIFASPATITGSIGVFGLLPTVNESLDVLGIAYDSVRTTEVPYYSMYQEISPNTAQVIQAGVDSIYTDFLQIVSEGREMSVDAVHTIAQGQVWSGERALKLGLVDEFGELEHAIAYAAQAAGLEQYQVLWPKEPASFMDNLLAQFGLDAKVAIPDQIKALDILLEPFQFFNEFNDPLYIYTRCQECIIK